MTGSQEVGCWGVGGYDTMKCSWCDELASLFCWTSHWWWGVAEQVIEWVVRCVLMKCSWSCGSEMNGHTRGKKSVATVVVYIVKDVGFLKTSCVWEV